MFFVILFLILYILGTLVTWALESIQTGYLDYADLFLSLCIWWLVAPYSVHSAISYVKFKDKIRGV